MLTKTYLQKKIKIEKPTFQQILAISNTQLCQNHPSIANIKRKDFDTTDTSFVLRKTNSNEVIKLMKTLNTNKTCQNAPTSKRLLSQMLKFLPIIYLEILNFCLKKGEFPCVPKNADVVHVHEKKETTNKKIYRQSILPILSNMQAKLLD